MARTDSKITLFNIRFNLNNADELDASCDTAANFFRFVQAFGNKLKLRNFVNIWVVEDRVQNLLL